MPSESLFSPCPSCKTLISQKASLCPSCNTRIKIPVSKIKVAIWIFICFTILNYVFSDKNPEDTISYRLNKVSEKEEMKSKLTLSFTWRKEGFGNVMIGSFIIINNSVHGIKDIAIHCDHYAPSGTKIDTNDEKLFEIVAAGATERFDDVNMGFINSQTINTNCSIKDFQLI